MNRCNYDIISINVTTSTAIHCTAITSTPHSTATDITSTPTSNHRAHAIANVPTNTCDATWT